MVSVHTLKILLASMDICSIFCVPTTRHYLTKIFRIPSKISFILRMEVKTELMPLDFERMKFYQRSQWNLTAISRSKSCMLQIKLSFFLNSNSSR